MDVRFQESNKVPLERPLLSPLTNYRYNSSRTQHNLSFFFVAAVYASRYENHAPCIRIWERRLLWFLPPVVLGICWIATMLFNASGVPYDAATDQWNFVLGIGAAVVPWVVAGFLTC